jgi:hypothetical protein
VIFPAGRATTLSSVILPGRISDVATLLNHVQQPGDFWELVKVVGLHSPNRFVLPNEIIGDQNGVWFQDSGEAAQYAASGTLETWNNEIGQYASTEPIATGRRRRLASLRTSSDSIAAKNQISPSAAARPKRS